LAPESHFFDHSFVAHTGNHLVETLGNQSQVDQGILQVVLESQTDQGILQVVLESQAVQGILQVVLGIRQVDQGIRRVDQGRVVLESQVGDSPPCLA